MHISSQQIRMSWTKNCQSDATILGRGKSFETRTIFSHQLFAYFAKLFCYFDSAPVGEKSMRNFVLVSKLSLDLVKAFCADRRPFSLRDRHFSFLQLFECFRYVKET